MLLRDEEAEIGDILSVMPDDIRDELLAFAGRGLKPEDAAAIFLVLLFERLDRVLYSKQLDRRLKERCGHVPTPPEFDKDRFKAFVRDAVDRLKGQMPSP